MSRGVRRAVLIALSLLLAGPLSIPPAAATTTVSTDGDVVTIHVPIDFVIVGADVVTNAQRERIEGLATMAQGFYWNPALEELPYGGCLTFELDLQVDVHADGVPYTPRDPTPHQIDWYDDPNVDSFVDDPSEPDHTSDSTGPFDGFVTGQWGDLDIGMFVHELGHLLGLGDDYVRVPDDSDQRWHAEDKPGREGTVMGKAIPGRWGHEGGSIDQQIVDRLGELIDEARGLPECWAGSMRSETKRTYTNPENAGEACTDGWEGELAFTVAQTGVVEGKGEATLTAGPACEFPGGHAFAVAKRATFSVEGNADPSGFTLRLGHIRWAPPTGASIAGFHEILISSGGTLDATPPGPPFEIPKLDPCAAEGGFTINGTVPPFDDPTVAESTMELRCSEPVAG